WKVSSQTDKSKLTSDPHTCVPLLEHASECGGIGCECDKGKGMQEKELSDISHLLDYDLLRPFDSLSGEFLRSHTFLCPIEKVSHISHCPYCSNSKGSCVLFESYKPFFAYFLSLSLYLTCLTPNVSIREKCEHIIFASVIPYPNSFVLPSVGATFLLGMNHMEKSPLNFVHDESNILIPPILEPLICHFPSYSSISDHVSQKSILGSVNNHARFSLGADCKQMDHKRLPPAVLNSLSLIISVLRHNRSLFICPYVSIECVKLLLSMIGLPHNHLRPLAQACVLHVREWIDIIRDPHCVCNERPSSTVSILDKMYSLSFAEMVCRSGLLSTRMGESYEELITSDSLSLLDCGAGYTKSRERFFQHGEDSFLSIFSEPSKSVLSLCSGEVGGVGQAWETMMMQLYQEGYERSLSDIHEMGDMKVTTSTLDPYSSASRCLSVTNPRFSIPPSLDISLSTLSLCRLSAEELEQKMSQSRTLTQQKISPAPRFTVFKEPRSKGKTLKNGEYDHLHVKHHGRAHNIIVLASLLEKPVNMGGLCRACEILGIQELVLPDRSVLRNSDFPPRFTVFKEPRSKGKTLKNGEYDHLHVKHHGRAHNIIVLASLLEKPVNMGGLCRACEILGIQELVLPDRSVLRNSDFRSAAVSSSSHQPLRFINRLKSIESYIDELKQQSYRIVALEQASESVSLEQYDFVSVLGKQLAQQEEGFGQQPVKSQSVSSQGTRGIVVLVGNERKGVPSDLLRCVDDVIEIPCFGTVRSFNARVATVLVLWECIAQLRRNEARVGGTKIRTFGS
ncbi:hypothetical protein ADUPG1_007189, partial [Aduncisulcus paluster]